MPGETPVELRREVRPSGLIIVTIVGDLDTYTTQTIEPLMAAAIPDRNSHVLVDISSVSFITSRALAMFVVHAKALRTGSGTLKLAEANDFVHEVFKRAGFAEIFPSYATREEGIKAMEADLAH